MDADIGTVHHVNTHLAMPYHGDKTMTDTDWVEHEAMQLEGTAEWRAGKAEEYAGDWRNAEAAKLCTELAHQLRNMIGSPKAVAFQMTHDSIFTDRNRNAETRVIEEWNRFRSGIGLREFPRTVGDYLDALIARAREIADT
jgi:hypothetical protein